MWRVSECEWADERASGCAKKKRCRSRVGSHLPLRPVESEDPDQSFGVECEASSDTRGDKISLKGTAGHTDIMHIGHTRDICDGP